MEDMKPVSIPIVLGGTLALGLLTHSVVGYVLARGASIPALPEKCTGFLECMFEGAACNATCDAARAQRDAAYDQATFLATPVAMGLAAAFGVGLYTYKRYW